MKYFKLYLTGFLALVITVSCFKSKLNEPVPGGLQEQELANNRGVQGLLIGAYAMLDGVSSPGSLFLPSYGSAASNWIYGSIAGTEAYTGSQQGDSGGVPVIAVETFTATAGNPYLDSKWAAMYEGIQRANSAIRVMRQAKDMSSTDTIEVRAEALFLRAFYHFELKKMWNDIPFVNENVTYSNGNYQIANSTSWTPIENDLLYATAHLPPSQGQQVGRVNKYAAEALLAKAYLFEQKYAQAKTLLSDLITNGQTSGGVKYDLLANYEDNFKPDTKNQAESVWAYQSSVNDGSVGWNGNGNTGDILNFPFGGPAGTCCGFFQPSQYLVNHFKTDPSTGLPDLDHFNDVLLKSDQDISSNAPFTPYTGTVDPRLDWTVGRRGIPYLDWGVHPGNDWIRMQSYGGPYSPKKNVFYIAEIAKYTQAQTSAINVNFIRFADVLLWAAEAEIESGGNLDLAQSYVNRVRNRAANPTGFVYTYADGANPQGAVTSTYAANYFIKPYPVGYFAAQGQAFARKALRFERMLEFGMEGHRFFDLVRWKVADIEINAYLAKEKNLRSYLNNAQFISGKDEYFPIPQDQIDLSNGKIKQNPGY